MKVLLVGGTFDDNGGKTSGIISKISSYMKQHEDVESIVTLNGGYVDEIVKEYEEGENITKSDVVMWFANVPNNFEKNRDLKKKYKKIMLVTSKRNFGEYSFSYLVNHALGLKSNLMIEFSKGKENKFNGRLLDPLGTVWHDYDDDFKGIVGSLVKRLNTLINITRKRTNYREEDVDFQVEDDFLNVVKKSSNKFHDLIKPVDGVTRFLGNSSFRCRHGFPSFRDQGYIFVTRRNIDKRDLGKEGFVPVKRGDNGEVNYFSEHKPSVDTPIQLSLYEYYKGVNYMLHSHVYIEDALFTNEAIPCGGLEEVDEIISLYPDESTTNVAINLIGHGSLILAETVEDLRGLASNYYSRPMPEVIENKKNKR